MGMDGPIRSVVFLSSNRALSKQGPYQANFSLPKLCISFRIVIRSETNNIFGFGPNCGSSNFKVDKIGILCGISNTLNAYDV